MQYKFTYEGLNLNLSAFSCEDLRPTKILFPSAASAVKKTIDSHYVVSICAYWWFHKKEPS